MEDLGSVRSKVVWHLGTKSAPFSEKSLQKARDHFQTKQFEDLRVQTSPFHFIPPTAIEISVGQYKGLHLSITSFLRSLEDPYDGHPLLEAMSMFTHEIASKHAVTKLSVDCVTWGNGEIGLHMNFLDGPEKPSYLWMVLLTPKMIKTLGGTSQVLAEIPVPYTTIDSPFGQSILGRVPLPLDIDILRKWRTFLEPVREQRSYRIDLQDRYTKTAWILPEDLEPGGTWTT